MNLGETIDSINAYTFRVNLGAKQTLYPYQDSVQLLTYVDGTQEYVNFGARVERQAELELVDIPRASYFALIAYLKTQKGSVTRFALSNPAENPWGVTNYLSGSVFYASLLDFQDLGETEFSVSGSLYGVRLTMSYVGTTSTSVPNNTDTSLLDLVLEIDTVRASYSAATSASLPASPTAVGGQVGFTTSDRKVWVFDGASLTWKELYTLTADVAAFGLVNGVFYLSAFADISSSSPGVGGKTYKSGLVNRESVTFPSYQIDLSQGPAVERLEGFTFALDNTAKFWTFVVENKITFYGATVKLRVYDRTNGRLVTVRTGTNYANAFDYTSYTFQVEPRLLNEGRSYPDKVITQASFPYSDVSKRGQPVISTYGRWERGELQVSNFTIQPQHFRSGQRYLTTLSYNLGTLGVRVAMDQSEFKALLGISLLSDYPGTNPVRRIYVHLVQQASDQPDTGKTRRVESMVSISSGITELRLKSAFAKDPDATTVLDILLSAVELLVDDDKVLGLRTANYLVENATGANIPKQLFASVGDNLEEVPNGIYQEVDATLHNRLTIDTDALDVDNFNNITVHTHATLPRLPNSFGLCDALFPGQAGFDRRVNRSLDFGFLYGIRSNKVEKVTGYAGLSSDTRRVMGPDYATITWTPPGPSKGFVAQRVWRWWRKMYQDLGPGVSPNYEVVRERAFDIADATTMVMVDTTMELNYKKPYSYTVDFIGGAGTKDVTSNSGPLKSYQLLDPKATSGLGLSVGRGDEILAEACLIWNRLQGQVQVEIYRDDILIDTLTSSTLTYYVITYAAHGILVGESAWNHTYQVRVNYSNTPDGTRSWYLRDGFGSNVFQLKGTSEPFTADKYQIFYEGTVKSNVGSNIEDGQVVRNFPVNNGVDLPAYAVIYCWGMRIDRFNVADLNLANATDVRLLCNFVVRSWYGTNTTVPVVVQLRGVRRDGTEVVLSTQSSNSAGLVGKAQTKGAFSAFLNLPKSQGGTSDAHYDTENQTSGSTPSDPGYGIYTGKDMWRLPDFLFADNAFEWNRLEYLYFAVTNAVTIPAAQVKASAASGAGGYHIGIGPLGAAYGGPTSFTATHRDTYLLEYTKVFEGGLSAPQFARIDGGVVDETNGRYTKAADASAGTALVERAVHVANRVIDKMVGYQPTYIGAEMRSRLDWIVHFQTLESRDLQAMLEVLARNLHCCFTLDSNDRLVARTLNHEEPNVPAVFAFTDSNVIKGSLQKVTMRKASEIFQKFTAKYNFEPSVKRDQAEAQSNRGQVQNPSYTEAMTVGWDLQAGKKVTGGFTRKIENADGTVTEQDVGDEDLLADLCKKSALLYTTGGKVNEYGTQTDELFELFYRPTRTTAQGTDTVERDLPNLTGTGALYNGLAKSPKVAMQELMKMLVKFYVFNTWTFSFKVNMKYTVYDAGVHGYSSPSWDLDGSVLTPTNENRLKLMDRVTFASSFFANGAVLDAFVVGIRPDYYKGTATITLFAFKPPGQLNTQIDSYWDAGYGDRNQADYVFKDESYNLTPAPNTGTFADAGFGTRLNTDYDFPNGTYADAQGEGTGQ